MAEIDVLTYGAAKSYTDKHGGGGGTSNYNALENKPQIGGNELVGNKTASDLGLVAAENGKSLSTNDYDNAEKQKNADNATAVSAIKGDIAPNFNATASYAVDDYVLKDGVLYKCTTAHTGAWDANDFTATTISDEITDVADAVDDIKDGTDIDSFGDVETALAGKQDTLTFDDVPTANSSNPVKSGGVYSALADKQDALTAGNYISIANDGTINVTQGIGVYDVYSYEIKSINSGYATKITKRKNGVFVSEQDISNGTYSSENRLNVDDRFEFWYTFAGYLWHYKLLVDSNEHQKDEEVSWEYSTLVDYTETFNVSQDSSTDLATKGDIEAAISSAYHHAGTKTCAELVAGLLVAGNEGNVYNMTDSGTTTADFIEGAGQPIKAGDNVGIAKISDGVYKFDLLSGFVDTSNFVQKSVTAGLLKNDGTVNDEIEGDVATLKSGLTTLDDEVNGDATVYPYADVITIPDAVPANLADCNVKIEPVQDLHGYDKPWVGGAGKNKENVTLTTGTYAGVTWTVYDDKRIKISGTVPGGGVNLNTAIADIDTTALAGYKFVYSTEGSGTFYPRIMNSDLSANLQDLQNGTIIADNGSNCKLAYRIPSNASIDKTISSMIVASTETDLSYAPYENICPISGHTEASVQRDGRNLFDKDDAGIAVNKYLNYQTGELVNSTSNWDTSAYIPVKKFIGEDIVFSGMNIGASNVDVCYYDSSKNYISGTSSNAMTYTIPSDTRIAYLRFDYKHADAGSIQLELGSTATPYVPYAGKTYTIALGDTIYGGTVNFDSGVMTVDRAIVDTGDLTYNEGSVAFYSSDITDFKRSGSSGNQYATYCISSAFEYYGNSDYEQEANGFSLYYNPSVPGCRLSFNKTIFDDYTTTQFKQWLTDNNVQVCYELATPTTIQLTPQQIQLLKGQNTITASTGQISVTVNGVSGSIGSLTADKQDKTDYALGTTAKTVVGAINEVQSGLATKVEMKTTQDLNSANKTGIYYFAYTAQNVPSAHSGTVLTLTDVNSVNGMQIARVTTENTVYVRFCDNSTWTAWSQLAITT